MMEYLRVNISGLYNSIFYWCNVDSIDKLKEGIELRFHIPAILQNVFVRKDFKNLYYVRKSPLTDEGFQELYERRFEIGVVDLIVEVAGTTIDTKIVETRRRFAAEQMRFVRVHLQDRYPYHTKDIDFSKDIGVDSVILDLKKTAAKHEVFMENMENGIPKLKDFFFLYKGRIIVTNEQLLVDLYLDDIVDSTIDNWLKLKFMIKNLYNCDEVPIMSRRIDLRYYSPHIRLFFPGMEALVAGVDGMDIVSPQPNQVMDQLDSIGYTKLAYPLLEMHSFDMWTMKCWIKHLFGIPCKNQVIFLNKYNDLIVPGRVILDKWEGCSEYYQFIVIFRETPSSKSFKPFNGESREINRVYSIPVNIILDQEVDDDGKECLLIDIDSGQTVNECIEEKYQIPKEKQGLFLNKKLISHQSLVAFQMRRVWCENLRSLGKKWSDPETTSSSKTPFKLHLVVIPDNDDIHQEPSIIIKKGYEDAIFCQFPLSALSQKRNDQYRSLCRQIRRTNTDLIPDVLCFTYNNDETIETIESLENLLVNGKMMTEELVLRLFLNPLNLHTNVVDEFCQKHCLERQIRIQSLTGHQLSVDLLSPSRKLYRIKEIKEYIYDVKGILPHLQSLYQNKVEMSNEIRLFRLLSTSNGVLNLIVKPTREIEVKIKCTSFKSRDDMNRTFVLLETSTMLDIKERIKEWLKVPIEYISSFLYLRRYCWVAISNDNTPIWTLDFADNLLELKVFKIINYVVKDSDNEVIDEEFYEIKNLRHSRRGVKIESFSVRDVKWCYEEQHKGKFVNLVEKPNITLDTLLTDVVQEVLEFQLVVEIERDSERRCTLC